MRLRILNKFKMNCYVRYISKKLDETCKLLIYDIQRESLGVGVRMLHGIMNSLTEML